VPEGKSSELNSRQQQSPTCRECERLWQVYAVATRKHLDTILEKEAATQTDDIGKLTILEQEAVEATQWWALARKAVRDHAATHARSDTGNAGVGVSAH
jgi:hypothetical protein